MSIDRCTRCDRMIDTDEHPEVYRDDREFSCLCDTCYEETQPCEHEWRWISNWMGDPSIPNGIMDCSCYECRLCGETKAGSPPKRERDPDDYEFRGFGYRRKE